MISANEMKNKAISSAINIFLCLNVFLAPLFVYSPVLAQTQNETRIPFSDVGITDLVLNGPYDSKGLSFSLPDNWQLAEGTAIELLVEVFITDDQNVSSQLDEYIGANLNVYFNRQLQQSISLFAGQERVYRIPVRVSDLNEETSDGRVQISFFLDAGIDCDYGFHKTTVRISQASAIDVFHSEKTPSLDLRNLPRPIYKRDSYIPEMAKVVVSEKASADELKAAYLVVSAFGRMTSRKLDLKVITSAQLTQPLREEAHLIFVGKSTSFPALYSLQMPVPITDGRFNSQVLQPDDGVVQLIVSPWNPSKVILIVGGNNDVGVVKASQALTTGNIQAGSNPSVSFIAQVAPLTNTGIQDGNSTFPSSLDYTMAELGYSVEQSGNGPQNGIGTQYFSYEFNMPFGKIAQKQTYFDLIFSHSSLIDPARSEISVYVNGNLANSIGFKEGGPNHIIERIDLPSTLFLPGLNQIDFAAELIPFDLCTAVNLNGLWMSIYPESSIHLELGDATIEISQLLELRNYPYPFLLNPTLSDLTIVLPQGDSTSWTSFGDLIYNLGGQATGQVMSFDVSFSGTMSNEDRQNNLILFGVPKDLSLDNELNAALPAPFEQNGNVATLDNQTVIYRIESNKSLGYLELLPSPWNKDKTVLAVLGTNHEGLLFSANAIIDSKIRSGLKGNFATIDGAQFVVVDTRSGLGLGSFPAAVGTEVVKEIVPTPGLGFESGVSQTYEGTRKIILIVLAFVIIIIFLMVVLTFAFRRRKDRKS